VKLSIAVNGRCSGGNHVHLTVTARREDDSLIGAYPVTLTAEQLFDIEVDDFLQALPVLIRGYLREQGYTRSTPLGTLRTAIESKVFRL
jgi:hypothetical protein